MELKSKLHGILSTILNDNAFTRANGRVASDRTTTAYGEVLKMCFNQLSDIGYKLQNPRNLNEGHVKALCEHWHQNGKSPATMQEYLSKLRCFSRWIGKDGMVKGLPTYLPNVSKAELRARKVAVKSKSWAEAGIDVMEKIEESDAVDIRFGMMVRMMVAFGLRRAEVLHNKPWKADQGDKLVIYPGTGSKGNRPRNIYIDNKEQRKVLDLVKSQFGRSEYFGWLTKKNGQPASQKYCLGRYNRCMAAIGITKEDAEVVGHGLRAQYAENAALIANLIPPTLGGTGGQMQKGDLDVKREQISELLGHSRKSITGAYYGSFGRAMAPDEVTRAKNNIEDSLRYLKNSSLQNVDADRMTICIALLAELTLAGIDISLKQVQALWVVHSKRFVYEWVEPHKDNAASLEAAAIHIVKSKKRQTAELTANQGALDLLLAGSE